MRWNRTSSKDPKIQLVIAVQKTWGILTPPEPLQEKLGSGPASQEKNIIIFIMYLELNTPYMTTRSSSGGGSVVIIKIV
jgi:hypothetical protein